MRFVVVPCREKSKTEEKHRCLKQWVSESAVAIGIYITLTPHTTHQSFTKCVPCWFCSASSLQSPSLVIVFFKCYFNNCIIVFSFTVEAEDVTVGKDPCTWGPSFWCASSENAAKCGSEVVYNDCWKLKYWILIGFLGIIGI